MSRPGSNRGENNFKNRLTRDDVLYIYNSQTETQQQLADRFGVSQSTINHIRKGRTWSWLTGARHG